MEVEKIFLNAGLTKEKAKSILLTPSKKEIITEFYADTVPKEKGDYQLICSMYNSVNTHNKRLYPNDNMYLTLIAFDYQNNGKLSKYFLEIRYVFHSVSVRCRVFPIVEVWTKVCSNCYSNWICESAWFLRFR